MCVCVRVGVRVALEDRRLKQDCLLCGGMCYRFLFDTLILGSFATQELVPSPWQEEVTHRRTKSATDDLKRKEKKKASRLPSSSGLLSCKLRFCEQDYLAPFVGLMYDNYHSVHIIGRHCNS